MFAKLKKLHPESALDDVRETLDPVDRERKIQRYRRRAERELSNLREQCSRLVDEIGTLRKHPGNQVGAEDQVRTWRRYVIYLLVADAAVQWYLLDSAWGGPFLATAAAAVGLAVGLSAIVTVTLLSITPRERPALAIRICRRTGSLIAAIGLPAVFIALLARFLTVDLARALETLIVAGAWGGAELLPWAAGAFGAAAHLQATPPRKRRELDTQAWRARELADFLEALDEEERAGAPAPGPREPAGAVPVASLLLLPAALLGLSAQAGAPCGLLLDETFSVDSAPRAVAVAALRQSLLTAATEFRCGAVVVIHFRDEGRFAPRRWIAVPSASAATCDSTASPKPAGARSFLATVPAFRESWLEEARAVCLNGQREAEDRYTASVQAFLSEIGRALDEVPASLTDLGNTDIVGTLEPVLEENPNLVVLVTDLLHNTPTPLGALRLRATTRLVIVEVPARPEYGGAEATLRASKAWGREVPEANLVAYTALVDPTFWHRVRINRQ